MRVAIIFVFVDYHRRGRRNRTAMQPQVGPLLAGLLPRDIEIDIVNETWEEPDWSRDYDLVFLSAMHSDFDRARQISHYWRRRGASTVIGGTFASTYPDLCSPYFDAVVVGDPEGSVPRLFEDFRRGEMRPVYRSGPFAPEEVPVPRYDLVLGKAVHPPVVLEATRGCPYTCDFCVLTGLGTGHRARPVERVLRDIRAGLDAVRGRVPFFQRAIVGFADNNLAGNPGFLRELCAALVPLRIEWYAAVTFNVVVNRELLRLMARAGCRILFVGLESFNARTIADMGKHQNTVHKARDAVENCRRNGIMMVSGLMVSPLVDDLEYLASIPDRLQESRLHLPRFVCFESPIPGTPHFRRLAEGAEPALLPNALLRDFTGYTLVVRPRHAEPEAFVAAYRDTVVRTYGAAPRARKVLAEVPRFLARGGWFPAVASLVEAAGLDDGLTPGRTCIAGTDLAPPERVPLVDADFRDEQERHGILDPWPVTDAGGRVRDAWRRPARVFEGGARGTAAARAQAAGPAVAEGGVA